MNDEAITVMAWLFVGLLLRAGWLLLRVLWWVFRGAWFIAVTLPHRVIRRRRAAHRYRQLIDRLIDEKATRDAAVARFERHVEPPTPDATAAAAVEDFTEWTREMEASDGDR